MWRKIEERLGGVFCAVRAINSVDTETEEATALEAVTKRQSVKIQQTEKTSYVL
jgi:hypothetical protein